MTHTPECREGFSDFDEGLHKIVMKHCASTMSMEQCRRLEIEILTYQHVLSECEKAINATAGKE